MGQTRYLYPLLRRRKGSPPNEPILVFSDDPLAHQLGNYVLYPSKMLVVNPSRNFGPPDLATHQSHCILHYLAPPERLGSVRSMLSQIACTQGGCLYQIRK